jgi:hypothetical protein
MMRIRLVSWREGTVVMERKRVSSLDVSIAGNSAPMRPIIGDASEDWQVMQQPRSCCKVA